MASTEGQLSKERGDREYQKFDFDTELRTVVKTLTKIYGGELTIVSPVSYTVHNITVTDVAAQFITNANCIAIDIFNRSQTVSIFHANSSGVTADFVNGTGGRVIGARENDNFSLSGISPYFICPTGQTAEIQITQWIKA